MKTRLFALLSMLVLFVAGCGTQSVPQDIDTLKGTVITTPLTGSSAYPAVNGKAKYKVDGSTREFQVEIEDAKVLAGKVLGVYSNSTLVGRMRVSALGTARLTRSTERGQTVPFISSGTVIRVRTGTGALVVSGTF